jgi:hypothetical protein
MELQFTATGVSRCGLSSVDSTISTSGSCGRDSHLGITLPFHIAPTRSFSSASLQRAASEQVAAIIVMSASST